MVADELVYFGVGAPLRGGLVRREETGGLLLDRLPLAFSRQHPDVRGVVADEFVYPVVGASLCVGLMPREQTAVTARFHLSTPATP